MPTFSAPDGSPKPSPVWNPDAEVGADYRIRPSPLERGAGHRFDFLLDGLCKLRNGPHSSAEGLQESAETTGVTPSVTM